MNRYFSSFAITLAIFISIIFSLIYFVQTPRQKTLKTEVKQNTIKFRVIKQEKKKEVIVKKTIRKKPVKKEIVKKALPKKEIIIEKPKAKKIVKKTKPKVIQTKPKPKVIPKEVRKKEIQKPKEMVRKQVEKKEITPSITKKPIINNVKKDDSLAKEKVKNNYFSKVKSAINENKSYPNKAKKRNIQGTVKIKFTLSNKGELLSYKILEGKKIFTKSITNAIENSFPIKTPNNVFSENIDLSLTLEYKLY